MYEFIAYWQMGGGGFIGTPSVLLKNARDIQNTYIVSMQRIRTEA